MIKNNEERKKQSELVSHDFAAFSSNSAPELFSSHLTVWAVSPAIWPCALDTRVSMRHKRCPPHSLQYDGVLATACQRKRWWEWRKRRGKINFLFGHSIRNRLIINRRLIHYWFRVKTLTKFPNWRESAVQSLQVAIKLLHRNPQTALSQCCQYTVLTV